MHGVAPLDEAGPLEMGFLALKRYARLVPGSRAGAFLVAADMESLLPPRAPRVVVSTPYPALRTLLARFVSEPTEPAVRALYTLAHEHHIGGW